MRYDEKMIWDIYPYPPKVALVKERDNSKALTPMLPMALNHKNISVDMDYSNKTTSPYPPNTRVVKERQVEKA